MKTYICQKREWESNYIFDVNSLDLTAATLSIKDEYDQDKSKDCEDEFQYYVEVWEDRRRVEWYQFNKEMGQLEAYNVY